MKSLRSSMERNRRQSRGEAQPRMRITEAYGKLDRRCVIAIIQESEVFTLISKLDEQIQAYFCDDDEGD